MLRLLALWYRDLVTDKMLKRNYGLVQGALNPGDCFMYNQKLAHFGGANLLYKARIQVVITFESQGEGKK